MGERSKLGVEGIGSESLRLWTVHEKGTRGYKRRGG